MIDKKHVDLMLMLMRGRSLAPWTILSISAYDDRASPYQLFKAWSMIIALIPVYYI